MCFELIRLGYIIGGNAVNMAVRIYITTSDMYKNAYSCRIGDRYVM